jgi:hypothetical protein
MAIQKDPELHTFRSGTRHFEPSARPTLTEALQELDRQRRLRPYRRTQVQIDAAKRVSDRMMGERDDNENA